MYRLEHLWHRFLGTYLLAVTVGLTVVDARTWGALAIASALVLADAIRSAPRMRGHFLEHAISAAMSIVTGESPWLRDEFLLDVLSPMTSDVAGMLAEGVRDVLLDALLDAFTVKQELFHMLFHVHLS
mgnify:CR=1 FL=1